MAKISYKTEVFEGPLDLLLHLISKNKLNIHDIPILELVNQYIAYVRQMEEENLELSSEFIEMAARLVYIKTVSLLPVHEEALQLKAELEGELVEYRDAKIIATKLSNQALGFERLVRDPLEIELDLSYNRLHEPFELIKYYIEAVGKNLRKLPPPIETFAPIVSRKIVSVVDKLDSIVKVLKRKKRQKLKSVFTGAKNRSDLVASFLAILELVKNKDVFVEGEGENMELVLNKNNET